MICGLSPGKKKALLRPKKMGRQVLKGRLKVEIVRRPFPKKNYVWKTIHQSETTEDILTQHLAATAE